MKLLILEVMVSIVYVFDVSAYPFMHIPFYVLTLLYFASIVEVVGIFRFARFVTRRLARHKSDTETTRTLSWIPFLALFLIA